MALQWQLDPDRLRIADLSADPFQRPNDVLTAILEAHIRRGAIAGMRIDNSQDPQLLAQSQLVMDKIHCPDIVRPNGISAIIAQLRLHRFGVLFRSCRPNAL
jgi:hypothetical protein